MAPKITLTYFDFPGRAEPIRMALAMTGDEWEDKRLSFEEFGALKPCKLTHNRRRHDVRAGEIIVEKDIVIPSVQHTFLKRTWVERADVGDLVPEGSAVCCRTQNCRQIVAHDQETG